MAAATAEVMAAVLACILVMHGGLAQAVVVAYALVRTTSGHLVSFLAFPGFEELDGWAKSMVSLALWAVVFPLALLVEPLGIALTAATMGSTLTLECGLRFLQSTGRLEEQTLVSPKGLMAFGALTGVGALWQACSWVAGSPMWWVFQFAYLPAMVAEGFLGLL